MFKMHCLERQCIFLDLWRKEQWIKEEKTSRTICKYICTLSVIIIARKEISGILLQLE